LNKNTLVVNIFGGPGSGKSTSAAGIFYLLKRQGLEAELVTEYAKDLVWEGTVTKLDYQMYIFAKQFHRVNRLLGKVDFIITDSPILLSFIYGKMLSKEFCALVQSEHDKMNTFNVLAQRVKDYRENGRLQTEAEAKKIDEKMRGVVSVFDLEAPGDDRLPQLVFSKIIRESQ